MVDQPECDDRRTFIVLGASNVVLGWNAFLRACFETNSEESSSVRVFSAFGMGRAWLRSSAFLIRRLPGLLECGLWDALRDLPHPARGPAQQPEQDVRQEPIDPASPCALITDVGNDLVMGESPDDLLTGVAEGIDRLRQLVPGVRIALSGLPLTSVEDLSSLRFRVARTVLFPGSDLTLRQIIDRSRIVQLGLETLCEAREIPLGRPDRQWYGLDPIHVRRRYRLTAFRRWTDLWGMESRDTETSAAQSPLPTAALRWVRGRERRCVQPSRAGKRLQVFSY